MLLINVHASRLVIYAKNGFVHTKNTKTTIASLKHITALHIEKIPIPLF